MVRVMLLAGATSVALATSALAADLPSIKGPPVYAPPPPPAFFTWTGFYIGINGGYGGDQFAFYDNDPFVDFFSRESLTSSGFLGGGTVGFNYQFPGSDFVAGVEGDFDGSSIKGEDSFSETDGAFVENESFGAKLNWLATVRGRLGYAISTGFGNILPYITGGIAFGDVTTFDNFSDSVTSSGYSIGHTWTGWTAGAGFEYAITRNLTFKTEYLYANLGTHEIIVPDRIYDPGETTSVKSTFNIVRAGLNWKFDWFAPTAPVVAKY